MPLARLLVCAAAASLVSLLPVRAAPALPGVGAAMQDQVDRHEIAGAVTLVATKDNVVHFEATGFADLEAKRPMETDAFFWIASTSKPFAGVAVLMLVDEGKLRLTDPVAKYLPAFADLRTPSGQPANLTVAQLLTHTSGLAELPEADYVAARNLAGTIDRVTKAPMQFEPDAKWKYTTSPFSVAGRIVELLSGETYDAFLQQRLFDPLGMKDTTFYPTDEQMRRLANVYARNRGTGELQRQRHRTGQHARDEFPPVPGGGLFSTAGDLGRFGRMLLNHGALDGRRYLSEAAYQALTTIRTADLATGFSAAQMNHVLGWGLGVFVLRTPHEGASATLSAGTFGHPGAYGTQLIVDPVKGVAYVMMIQRPNLADNFENETSRAFLQAVSAAMGKNRE